MVYARNGCCLFARRPLLLLLRSRPHAGREDSSIPVEERDDSDDWGSLGVNGDLVLIVIARVFGGIVNTAAAVTATDSGRVKIPDATMVNPLLPSS